MSVSTELIHSPCLICGDKSVGINFGVLTCMACKAFFRRNAAKIDNHQLICKNDGQCTVTYTNRRICKYCRLIKCFRTGMIKELILSAGEKEARQDIIRQNRQKKHEKTETSPQLALTRSPRLYPTIHNTSLSLSLFDNTLLSNIFNAYDQTCIASKSAYKTNFPCIIYTSTSTFMNEYSNIHQSLILYYKRIPEFNTISIGDKIRLLKNQFGITNVINMNIIYPDITSNLISTFTNIFGIYLANRLLQSIERVHQFIYDPVILKLLLIIVNFSSTSHRNRHDTDIDEICDNTLAIFAAQNVYVELLWKYILTRSSTESDAVKYFNKLILLLFFVYDGQLSVDGYINNLPSEIEQMDLLMQSMWPNPVQTN